MREKLDELGKELGKCEDAYLGFRYTHFGSVYDPENENHIGDRARKRNRGEHKIALDVLRTRLFVARDEYDRALVNFQSNTTHEIRTDVALSWAKKLMATWDAGDPSDY